MEEKISVIVSVYNKVDYLNKCIESICQQTYKNLEIILVDDGSNDGSESICDDWARMDTRIVTVHVKNGGISKARNIGIEYATGEWIGFVDADDFIEANMYSEMKKVASKQNADIVICGLKKCYGHDIVDSDFYYPSGVIEEKKYYELMYEKNQRGRREHMFLPLVVAWTKLYKRNIFENEDCRFVEGHIYEDNWIVHHLVSNAKKIYWLNENLYVWRQVDTSIVHSSFSIKRFDEFYAQLDRLEVLKKRFENEFFYQQMIKRCLDNGIQFWAKAITDDIANFDNIIDFKNSVDWSIRSYGPKYKGVSSKLFWYFYLYFPKIYLFLERIKHNMKR